MCKKPRKRQPVRFSHSQFKLLAPENLLLETDCILMDEKFAYDYEKFFIKKYNDHAEEREEEDYSYLPHYDAYIWIKKIHDKTIEVSYSVDMFTRGGHGLTVFIPKNKIKFLISNNYFGGDVNIFVDSKWLNELQFKHNSIFVWTDAINVKQAIANQEINSEKLITLRNCLDKLSKKYPEVSFISFADNVLLKSNWTIHKSKKYKPEIFLKIFGEIREAYQSSLKLGIYGIFTQGTNEYYESNLLHISSSKNHICLNSLGTPFAQLLEIERSFQKYTNEKFDLYLSADFYLSLNFKLDINKEETDTREYESNISKSKQCYYCQNYVDLINNLRDKI